MTTNKPDAIVEKKRMTLRRWLYEHSPQAENLLRRFDEECDEIIATLKQPAQESCAWPDCCKQFCVCREGEDRRLRLEQPATIDEILPPIERCLEDYAISRDMLTETLDRVNKKYGFEKESTTTIDEAVVERCVKAIEKLSIVEVPYSSEKLYPKESYKYELVRAVLTAAGFKMEGR